MGRKTIQNKITSPELLALVNQENIQLMNDFLSYLRSIQRSEGTIAGYKNDIEIFFVYLLQFCGNKHFTDVTKREIVGYQNWLLTKNQNSPARVRRMKSAISSMSNYIENILDDEFNGYRPIVRKIEDPINRTVREKTIWTDEELDALLDYLVSKKQYKKACAVALGMCSGRRKSELVRFKVSYFDDSNIRWGSVYKTPEKILTKGRAGGTYLTCYILKNKFKPYFDMWMAEREKLGITSEWLLPDEQDQTKQMNPMTLTSWSDGFTKITGKIFYWHSLRHYHCTHLAKQGLPDSVIQKIIGWKDVSLVGVYKDIDDEDEFEKYFSDDGILAQQPASLSDL